MFEARSRVVHGFLGVTWLAEAGDVGRVVRNWLVAFVTWDSEVARLCAAGRWIHVWRHHIQCWIWLKYGRERELTKRKRKRSSCFYKQSGSLTNVTDSE